MSLSLLTVPAVHAAPTATRPAAPRAQSATSFAWRILIAIWQAVDSTNTHGPKLTQGPTVDPNGVD
ncbi:MAG TPA: hypothetical protein VMM92_07610 [Thermoanaerobaculia bacterium]|nr:hypothetical protein [Thermoanaerobaculia bacterium]